MQSMVLGVDIGGTKCAVISGKVYYNENFHDILNIGNFNNNNSIKVNNIDRIEIINRVTFPTEPQKGPIFTLSRIIKELELLINKNNTSNSNNINGINNTNDKKFEAIGISCGGPLDSKNGIILSPPNLIGWDNIEIVKLLENHFGIKTKLQNDANACALAEWQFGAGKGYENLVFLTFGTGMGAGLILNGKLYSGTNDMAGEVGHVRLEKHGPVGYGKSGSFEGFCSGGGIAQLARTRVIEALQKGKSVSFLDGIYNLDNLNAKLVAEAALNGDDLAKEIYRECGYYLGMGLSMIIDIINPEIIIIGSIFGRSKDLLWPQTEQIIKKESLELSYKVCKIVPAALGDAIGDYASLAVALN